MATLNVPPPDNFNFKRPEEFDKWFQRLKRFSFASGLNAKEDCIVAEDNFKSVELTDLTEENVKVHKDVGKTFENLFVIRRNAFFEKQHSILYINNLVNP
ncbi:hypothetical protein MAR_017778 [Mya arenaria]|uniref:Uncharacterized protein n=1 Tax=Mya arenaria TaxID=6604 RepID=A0ABY7ECT3_MYAAR|nr:hypothetical protein MAR_017778 [Mya arenaria]